MNKQHNKETWEEELNSSMNDVIRATKNYITSEITKEERDKVYQGHGIKIEKHLKLSFEAGAKAERKRIESLIDLRAEKEDSIFYDNAVLFLKMDLGLIKTKQLSHNKGERKL